MSISPNILVIDDEQVITDAVVKICSLENYSVETSLNVQTATEKLSKKYYPIIVCDIMMHDGDGFQILEYLRNNHIDSALIMMTGYSTVENAVNSLYQGAVDFIPKPFTVDELLNSVYRANKYQEIKNKQALLSKQPMAQSLLYVTCPAKYLSLGYSSWMYQENDGSVLIGVCDLFLKTIESVKEIEFLKTDEEIAQGVCCVVIASGDERTHKVLSPVSGRIIDVNHSLNLHTNIIEKDPYFEGWIYRVIPTDIEYETKHLIPYHSDRL